MHRMTAGKSKKIITATIAGIVAASVIGGAIYNSSFESVARASLPGVEGIVMANNRETPFTILEIVPDYSAARIGYTIAGEEPGDVNTAKSINDMGSQGERADYYMKATTTTENTAAFADLKDKAFGFGAYNEDSSTITAETEGVKKGYTYGTFTPNASSNGFYEEASANSVYGYLGDGQGLTINDVVNGVEGTKGEGIFYMDYVEYNTTIGGGYKIKLTKQTSGDEWKKPFMSYTDSDGVDYFADDLFVVDKSFGWTIDDNGTEEVTDDSYVLNTEDYSNVASGDVIFKIPDNSDNMEYLGYVFDDNGTLKFTKDGVNFDPIFGLISTTSFAGMIHEASEHENPQFVTIRHENSGDVTADKYYVTDTTSDSAGAISIKTYSKQPVNDKTESVDVFGITDELTNYGYWYHTWFYKLAEKDPYIYDASKSSGFDFNYYPSAELVKEFYYTGGYDNKEWFKKNVLDIDDDKLDSFIIDVVTKKIEDVSADDIYNSDLIYFAGINERAKNGYSGVANAYTTDLSAAAAAALVRSIDDAVNKPVILNLSCADFNFDKNIDKVISIMLSGDVSNAATLVAEDGSFKFSEEYKNKLGINNNAFLSRVLNSKDSSHVTGSIFINDDYACGDAISANFNDEYSGTKIKGFPDPDPNVPNSGYTYSFSEVEKDIAQELFYLSVAGKSDAEFVSKVSKATSIRYILNYGNRRIIGKTAINVLDIEPYYNREVEKSKNFDCFKEVVGSDGKSVTITNYNNLVRDIFDATWFCKNVSDSTDESAVSVTGVGTKEFVGKIEDLSENYDLIYIGLDTAYLNTEINTVNVDGKDTYEKSDKVVSNVQGSLIYKRTGDQITTNGMDGGDGTYAMSGNDITPDKFRELKEYVSAGYAVILSDKFFVYNDDGTIKNINSSLVASNSYMYKFVEWCWEKGKLGENVGIKSDFDRSVTDASVKTTTGLSRAENCAKFINYLNISKLKVEVISQPALYNTYDGSTNHNYLRMNNDGIYTLDYEVRLTNDAATGINDNSYDCKLYIDYDGDGRFEPIEELKKDTMYIYNADNNDRMYVQDDGKFHLTTGSKYTISRRVPDGYVGLISWKLVFVENGKTIVDENKNVIDDVIRVAFQDYSAISDRTNKPKIKVLQLTSKDDGKGVNGTATTLNLKTDKDLQEYYKQVIDFEISSDTIDVYPVRQYIDGTMPNFKNHLDKLMEYDMIVLGFTDMYGFETNRTNSEAAMLAIRQYMLSGRSILFTHDLTSTRWNNDSWGTLANKFIRDIQGMDRYDTVKSNLVNKTVNGQSLLPYVSKYDLTDEDKIANKDKYGYADSTLLRYNSSTYGEIAPYSTKKIGTSERELTTVARVNRGQITEYPFRIGTLVVQDDGTYAANELVDVAKTHHQYFQLNLETDYTDDNYDDDIVVWYAISSGAKASNNYHKLDYNDVRNNYYIYSKGNVTYTGAGHSSITGEVEKKLFVNTLVAAYNAGVHPPYVSYRANGNELAQNISSIYVPYDLTFADTVENGGENDGWTEGASKETVTVYFETINNNLKDSLLPLTAEYYVEVPSDGDIQIGDKSYKIIKPVKVTDCLSQTELKVSENTNKFDTLTSGRIYKLEFMVTDLLAGNSVKQRHSAKIATRLSTSTTIADMDKTVTVLPATDSLKELNINFSELYDLK